MFRFLIKTPNLLSVSFNALHVQAHRSLNYTPIQTENKIEVGHNMTRVIEKYRKKYVIQKATKEATTHNQLFKPNPKLLIACSNPVFNYFVGQTYKAFSPRLHLASFGWTNRSSEGKYFTINPVSHHPSIINATKYRNERDEAIEFTEFKLLNPVLCDLLAAKLSISQPTHIQYMSVDVILRRENHNLLVAETGGGKTLAYTLPLIEICIRTNMFLNRENISRGKNQPIGIILVPTRELACQVYTMVNQLISTNTLENERLFTESQTDYLTHLKALNVVVDLHEKQIEAKQKYADKNAEPINCVEKNEKAIDILITLPGQLEKRQRENYFNGVYLRQFVLDEADSLLDDSFSLTTLKAISKLDLNLSLPKLTVTSDPDSSASLLEKEQNEDELMSAAARRMDFELELKLRDPSTQLLFVSATIPRGMKDILEDLIDCDTELKRIATSKVNRLMLHVPQKFFRTNGDKRLPLLLETVRKEIGKANKASAQRTVMIFSHRTNTVKFVARYLKENGIECEMLINQLNNEQRENVVSRFFKGEVRVLCCTDIASRGWNTLHVNHVINFEMPPFIADYVHRCGRVGRLNSNKSGGGASMVTNFITKGYEVDMCINIEKSLRLGVELENVNANIKRIYTNLYTKSEHSKQTSRYKNEPADENDVNISTIKPD